ncbi:conjugative transposon protein TraM [Bacteroidia bacterium]|nr:conjugative transposon protein TraM [Bacteroidia bacterium]
MSNMENEQENGKQSLTGEQKQTLKKYVVFALMFVIFGGCMWLIFAPSAEDRAKETQTAGFNADIPMPKEEGIIGDKRDAYEQEQVKQRQAEKMRSLNDFSVMMGGNDEKPADDLALIPDETTKVTKHSGFQNRSSSSIQKSANAYRDINRTLGSFYEKPKEEPKEAPEKEELEEMKAQLSESENRQNKVDEQTALMEKAFQMAAKYLPVSGNTPNLPNSGNVDTSEPATKNASGKTAVASVSQITERTVSALPQDMSSLEIVEALSQPRNMGFYTAASAAQTETKNTISACIHDDQSILDGQSVRLRLTESMQAGNVLIPRNTIITGLAKIQGERLGITVVSLEFSGKIIPVELFAYDTDGQQGISVPNIMELNAAKEIAANMGTSAGTSISLTSDAGEQFAADMGRSLVQGTSQFFSKKLREVKVNLKAGYKILLLPNDK